ncbi:MAG: hypothetical protein M1457_11765, partial [bacterium]|nr:hypothetical protein [bacterium]
MNHAAALDPASRIGLLIEPLDTLFFRDGRPFASADRGHSDFPTPQTLAGMLRTHLMALAGVRPGEIHGLREHPDHPTHWISHVAFQGLWLAQVGTRQARDVVEPCLPAPAHLMQTDDDPPRYILHTPLSPAIEMPGWQSPSLHYPQMRPLMHLGSTDGKLKPCEDFLTLEGLKKVLQDETPGNRASGDWIRKSCLFDHEERVGIGIDAATGTTGDGRIYSARHLRLCENVAFYAEAGWESNGAAPPEPHWLDEAFPADGVVLPFGGEGRRVLV